MKLGMGVGAGPPRVTYWDALWPPNLVGRTPNWRIMHSWGQRSFRDQPRSTRGQSVQECSMATKFSRKNPWPKCSALIGSKVMQVSAGVSRGQISQECSIAINLVWAPEGNTLLGVNGHVWSAGVNQRSNCLEILFSHQMLIMLI